MTALCSGRSGAVLPALAAFIGAALLLVTACGDQPGQAAEGEENGAETEFGERLLPAAEGEVEYPLTIDTVHGEIELPERPERVAVMGHTANHDAVAALGVTPVYAGANRPIDFGWTDPGWHDAIELVDERDSNDVNVEGVAALEPDLIVMPNTTEMYEEEDISRLSEVAPVLENDEVVPGDQLDWREATRDLGRALDLTEAAEDAVAEAEQAIEDTAAEHPEFEGSTITLAYDYGEEYGIDYYTVTGGTAEDIVSLLGFASNPLAEQFTEDPTVSEENQAELDADILVMFYSDDADQQTREDSELFQQIPAVQDGRYVGVSAEQDARAEDGAIWALRRGTSPLSVPWTLDALSDWASQADLEE